MKSILSGFVCALFLGTAQAASVTLAPVSFGTAIDDNKDGIFDTMGSGIAAASTGFNETFHGLIEYDLSTVSGNVTSATLMLHTGSVQYDGALSLDVQFHGYTGNGVVELSDALVDNLITAVEITEIGIDLNIDVTSFVQMLPTYAGFMLRLTDETVDEAQQFNDDPTLVVNYSPVPIPPALYLFGSGLIGLIGMARRKAA